MSWFQTMVRTGFHNASSSVYICLNSILLLWSRSSAQLFHLVMRIIFWKSFSLCFHYALGWVEVPSAHCWVSFRGWEIFAHASCLWCYKGVCAQQLSSVCWCSFDRGGCMWWFSDLELYSCLGHFPIPPHIVPLTDGGSNTLLSFLMTSFLSLVHQFWCSEAEILGNRDPWERVTCCLPVALAQVHSELSWRGCQRCNSLCFKVSAASSSTVLLMWIIVLFLNVCQFSLREF